MKQIKNIKTSRDIFWLLMFVLFERKILIFVQKEMNFKSEHICLI